MKRLRFPSSLIFLILLSLAPQAWGTHPPPPLTCADKSIVAGAVREPQDAQVFVQCAYEYVQEMGTSEARRAFNEDERWKHGPTYLFVNEATPVSHESIRLVFPPDPAQEGMPRGMLGDAFGDHFREIYRIVHEFGEGWVYYGFTNPATGQIEPKITYVRGLDWNGTPAVIGAGVYRRDLPGACAADEVNSGLLESDPSNGRLQEFVRCAALELEANGYFAIRALSIDPRWRNQSVYLFGLDTNGTPLFSGNPYSQWRWGGLSPELTDQIDGPFGGRDVVSVGDSFGETFLYYSTRNPSTGMTQGKVAFVKRVVVSGLPILIGSGYYLDGAVSTVPGDGSESPPSQAGRVVVAGADAMLGDDDFILNSATITGDTLTISASYSGGCKTHMFTLVIAASFLESSPVRLPAVLRHDANGDTCEAFPTESYAFDLGLVKARYREAYGSGAGRVALQLNGYPADDLVYEFTE